MPDDQIKYSVRAASRALRVLRCFDARHLQRSYQDIAAETGIPVSTVFKLVQVLLEEDFLEQSANGRFSVGLEAFRLGELYLTNKPLVTVADCWLERLAERVGLSANLGIRDGGSSVAVLTRAGADAIKVQTSLGDRFPLYVTALGKALALDSDAEALARLFPPQPWPQRTPRTITGMEQLSQDIARSRERGYTIDTEEGTLGIRCVGCPIRDHRGAIVAAISATGTTMQLTEDILPSIVQAVRETAGKISRELGYCLPEQRTPEGR